MNPLKYSTENPLEGGASFSFRDRLRRLLWTISWALLASWTPPPLHRWRIAVLRCFGASVHSTAHIYGSAKIWYPSNLKMGAYSCLGPGANCYCMALVSLGEKAIVSQGAYLCAGTHDIDDSHHQLIVKPIVVGEGVWIAAEAFIGPGVTINAGAVIGARAVLFADAEAFGVYAGNPAKLIRYRERFK